MKETVKITLTAVCCFFSVHLIAQHAGRVDFGKDWKFKLDDSRSFVEPATEDKDWRTIDIPHDWSIEGNFSMDHPATAGGGALPGGIGWYRKLFTIREADKDKKIFIQFDGVYRNSEVWINGHSLGIRPNGYISFQYDLTPYLNDGNKKNLIAVRVDNSNQPNSRWYSGSGIYRNVWLTVVDKIHIDNWGTFITTPLVNKDEATVDVETKLVIGKTNLRGITLATTVYNSSGKKVAQTATLINSHEGESCKQTIKVFKPMLWSIDKPSLYRAVSQLIDNGKITDTYETKFGIRSFKFDVNKGFFLNGKHVKIVGVCNHHDLGALGSAINTRALQRQL